MINTLIDKLAKQEQDAISNKIFSPYIKGGAKIAIKINKIIYFLKTNPSTKDGFGIFYAKDFNFAERVREANLVEISQYLELLPKVEMILLHKISNRWLAHPVNSDFKLRFGMDFKPHIVFMADGVNVLDKVIARYDGNNFWFDSIKVDHDALLLQGLKTRLDAFNYNIPSDLKGSLSEDQLTIFKLAIEFHRESNMSDLEKRVKKSFESVDAKVDNLTEKGSMIEVAWKDSRTNKKYTSVLNKDDLSVITAGICLSGLDSVFDLHSLVSVAREGERNGSIHHVGPGGMNEQGYWDRYNDHEDDY